ncbi:MAG TPA: HBL/NHE enterotoxin family protein [Thermoanaerobaculia bacterium]
MLSPNKTAITSQVTSDYAVNSYLMAWAHTLLNTNLYPLEPRPTWFEGIASELTATKAKTQTWLHEDFPDIAAALPQSLINYANLFGPAVSELAPLLAKGNPVGDDRATVDELLEALQTAAKTHQFRVLGLQRKVVAFAKVAKESSTKMVTNAKEVKKTIGAAQKDLLALQSRIADLQRRLGVTTTEAKNSMSGAAMTGATITMTMLAFTVGAAAFPIVGLAGAVIGIAFNAAQEAARSKEVLALIREIGELQVKLSNEQYQIAALETIATSFENLSDVVSEALTCMEGTVHHWDDIVTGLAEARELVAQPGVDLMKIAAFKELNAAVSSWATIAERCRNIQNSVMQIASEPILVGGSAA